MIGTERTSSGLIRVVNLSHWLEGRYGRFECRHPDRHDYLIAAEVQHAADGPDLAAALAEIMDYRVRSALMQQHYEPRGGDLSDDGHSPGRQKVAALVQKAVCDYIPRSLRGEVTAWSVRVYPDGHLPEAEDHAEAQRFPRPGYDGEAPAFPYHLPGYGQALDLLRSWDNHSQQREGQEAADLVRRRTRLDRWRPDGCPPRWTEALDLAEAGLEHHVAAMWSGHGEEMREATVAGLGLALYLAAVEAGIAPGEVRIEEQIVPHQTDWHELTGWAERVGAAGHDLADAADPVVGCWDMLRYDYREPDARVDPIAAKIYDEDSTVLSGTRLNLGLSAALSARAHLWPDGVVAATGPNRVQAVRS